MEVEATRTEALKKYITKTLKEHCNNVFYQSAIDTSLFPYIVYEIDYIKNENLYNYSLTINIWDKSNKTKEVEKLADDLEQLLDKEYFTDNIQSLTIDLNSRNNLEDEDKSLKHIVLLFDLQYYYQKG